MFETRTIEAACFGGKSTGVPLEMRRVLLGHPSGDITTHYSAPEIVELAEAANKVCPQETGKSPALLLPKQKAATG